MKIAINTPLFISSIPIQEKRQRTWVTVFAHDVPLMHARRCKGVGWLIKNRNSKEEGGSREQRGEKTTIGRRDREKERRPREKQEKKNE